MILHTLGVAGSAPSPQSAASTYLVQVTAAAVVAGIAAGTVLDDVEVRDWNLVMDLGSGGLGPLQGAITLDRIDAVAISHLHPDHCADVCGLYVHLKYHPVFGAMHTGTPARLPVYGPANTATRIAQMYGLHDGETMEPILDFRAFADGGTVRLGPLTIETRLVFHPVETFGMRITGPSTVRPGEAAVLAYTGDTDYCESVVELARDADVLLAESAFVQGRDDRVGIGIHLNGASAGRVAREAGARRLVLTHIPAWTDPMVVLDEAATEYHGSMVLAAPRGAVRL